MSLEAVTVYIQSQHSDPPPHHPRLSGTDSRTTEQLSLGQCQLDAVRRFAASKLRDNKLSQREKEEAELCHCSSLHYVGSSG